MALQSLDIKTAPATTTAGTRRARPWKSPNIGDGRLYRLQGPPVACMEWNDLRDEGRFVCRRSRQPDRTSPEA